MQLPHRSTLFPYTTLFRSTNSWWDRPEDQIPAGSRSATGRRPHILEDRKSTRLNSSHVEISYAVFCLKKKIKAKLQHNFTNSSTIFTPNTRDKPMNRHLRT